MNNEFAQLLDLALSSGIKHSEIISSINEAVTSSFKSTYPGEKRAFSVVVDEKNGTVRLISGNTDITPPDFSFLAASTARQTLIQILKKEKETPLNTQKSGLGTLISSWITALLFWGYNSLYLFLFVFSLIGLFNTEFRKNVFEFLSSLGIIHGILAAILVTTPIITTFYALRGKIRKSTINISKLFFTLEVPLVFMILILLTTFHNAIIPIQVFSFLSVFIPLIVYLHFNGFKPALFREKLIYLVIIIPILLGLSYITILFSFFLPLIIGTVAKSFFGGFFYELGYGISQGFSQSFSIYSLIYLFLAVPFILLFAAVFIFLLILPYQLVFIFTKLFIIWRRQLISAWTKINTDIFCLVYSTILILIFAFISYQPDINPMINKLSKLTLASTFEEKETIAKEIMPEENTLKQVLLDMYNARSRYPFNLDDDYMVNAYKDVFNIDYSLSGFIQSAFHLIAYPFTYQGTTKNSTEAAANYQYLFGHTIYESTNISPEVKEVALLSRKVSVIQDYAGLFATVSFEDEYGNNSYRNQEVIYEFSLPSDAVVTSLKLGSELEYSGIISPKGAAQKVYQQEVDRSRDPALLEQTGPRQYRLRVFPIPGRNDLVTLKGKNQKVQFIYVTGVQPEGFPLPIFSKVSNLNLLARARYTFLLNNEIVTAENNSHFLKNPITQGSPFDLCSVQSEEIPKTPYHNLNVFVISHLQNEYFRNNSICNKLTGLWFPNLLKNYKIAVLMDVSYDNRESKYPEELRNLLKSDNRLTDNNKIDLYLFNDKISESKTLTPQMLSKPWDIIYFGKSDLNKTLASFNQKYDFAVIVTGKNISIDPSLNFMIPSSFPIYLIHQSGEIPSYGNVLTEYLIKSHGKITDTFQETFNHFILSKQLHDLDKTLAYIDVEPYWSIGIRINKNSFPPDTFPIEVYYDNAEKELFSGKNLISFKDFPVNRDDPLSYIVGSKYLTDSISRQSVTATKNTELLDEYNNFAKRGNFVTPYSSLIALVNDLQRANLDKQEQSYSRYDENNYNTQRPGDIVISRPESLRITSPNLFFNPLGIDTFSLKSPETFGITGGSGSLGSFNPASNFLSLFIPINLLLVGLSLLFFVASFIVKSISRLRKKKTP